jgi:HlyD family secretion protein
MHRKLLLSLAGAIAIAVAIGAYFLMRGIGPARQYQGWVEADFLFFGADEQGRLVNLAVREGDAVKQGQPLFALQNDIQEADRNQARAALDEARARLARAEAAQQRPEEVAVLEAQETRYRAALEQSQPEFERAKKLVAQGTAAPNRLEQAKAAFERDQAQLAEVRRQIEVARLKARSEDIDAAREVVKQAEAKVASAQVRLQQRDVVAPADGVVQEIYFRTGEIVPIGRPVLSLLPPGNLKLRFFLPQDALPRIAIGDTVTVQCDGCSQPLAAEVRFLSRQAEFTPPVIFSSEERAKLVFRAEATPQRPDLLRVGQPVSISVGEANRSRTAYGRK